MDPQDQQPNPETTGEVTDPPEGTEGQADENGSNDDGANDVPAEVLRANLTKANQEAARYRTRLREVEKALEGRKTEEEVQALLDGLTNERETAERSLLIENVALKFNLPEELAVVLQGSTREELETHAQTLAKFAPKTAGEEVPPGDLSGGLNPGSDTSDDGLSPLERVRALKRR